VRVGEQPKEGKMELVDVEMENVELVGTFAHAIQHEHVVRNGVSHIRVESQRRRRATHKPRRRHGIAAREQGDVMARADEFFCEI
jgi:hypothetical protein